MAEETNQNVVQKQETTEVIPLPGNESSTSKAVSSMFDKIAEGKAAGKTSRQVVQEQKQQQKPDKQAAQKQEVKTDKQSDKQPDKKEGEQKPTEEVITRDSLRKATEQQAATDKADKQEKSDKQDRQETQDQELPEEELQESPHDKPKTAQRIRQLWKKVKTWEEKAVTTEKQLAEKAKALGELEAKLKDVKTVDPKTEEENKKKLDELAMFRRRYELDKDPEVKTKFEGRIESAEKSITETLVANKAGEGLMKEIQRQGGWVNFSQSARPITVSDGEGGTKVITCAELADLVLANLPLGERKSVEAAMLEQVQTKRDRDRFFQEEQAKANEFFKKREEEAVKAAQENQKKTEESGKIIEKWHKEALAADWLKDKEVASNASPAEKAAAEEHNKYNKQLRSILEKSMGVHDVNGLLEIVLDSVRYYDERRTTSSLRKEIESLRKELESKKGEVDKVKKAGSSVPKSGSIAPASQTKDSAPEAPRDIHSAFDHIARHGKGSLAKIGQEDE